MTHKQDDQLVRFSTSMESALLNEFDQHWPDYGFGTRSEAIRDLIRGFLVEKSFAGNGEVMALLVYMYDHHVRETTERLVAVQHDHDASVIVTMHVHVDHDTCLETAVVRGHADTVKDLAAAIRSIRGVSRTMLVPAGTIPETGDHHHHHGHGHSHGEG